MKHRTTAIGLAALGTALLLGAPSYAQNLDKPPSATPPAPSAQKSWLKKPSSTTGKFSVSSAPASAEAAKDLPEAPRADSKFMK